MKRRTLLKLASMLPIAAAAPSLLAQPKPLGEGWRRFELTYRADLSAQSGAGRLWLPLPRNAGNYQRVLATRWQGAAPAGLHWDPLYEAPMFVAEWGAADTARAVTVTVEVATRDRHMAPPARALRDIEQAALYLQPTTHMPVDGIVADTARKITAGIRTPDDQARAIYDWIVDNTFREPSVRGCGMGNIKAMLETGNLGGKCADINSLFVGLARAAGIPAREMYGVRVAESQQMACLGKSGDVSKAQHCRAEYFSPRRGWVPVDPADVRKAVLEARLAVDHPQIVALRQRLFGYWEMNWVGFNHARDFELNPAASGPLPYLMYPYAEFGETRLDGRDPAAFSFSLNSRELGAA